MGILATRKMVWTQGFLFAVLLVSISLTERVNEWLAANYKLYSKLQYFDSQGMFISLTYSAPVLINCVIILVRPSLLLTWCYSTTFSFRLTGSLSLVICW